MQTRFGLTASLAMVLAGCAPAPVGAVDGGEQGQRDSGAAVDAGSAVDAGQAAEAGPAAVELSATPLTVEAHETVAVTWSATADACRYDGSSFPTTLNGWPETGYACLGADACAQRHDFVQPLDVAGVYTFKLTCDSPAHGSQPATTAAKSAVVTVTPRSCIAPAGLTRQTTGKLTDFSGGAYGTKLGTDLTQWFEVFGWDWATSKSFSWPGIPGGGSKIQVNKNQYLALEFTIPADYTPLSVPQVGPSASFHVNNSDVSNGVSWAASISHDCGDFNLPAQGDPDAACFATFVYAQSGLSWVVTPPDSPLAGACNLHPGGHYYFNVVSAPFEDVTQSDCPDAFCTQNFQIFSTFPNGTSLN